MGEVANHVRRLRFEHNEMTQQELADRAGCTRQTIIALEQRRYLPSLALAFRIARAFGLPFEKVFEYVEELGGQSSGGKNRGSES